MNLYRAYSKWHHLDKNHIESIEIEKLDVDYPVLREDTWFAVIKGKYYFNNEEYDKAIATLELAKQSCSSKNLCYILGACNESAKRFDRAEEQYKFLRDAIPGLVRPSYLLAKLYRTDKEVGKRSARNSEL